MDTRASTCARSQGTPPRAQQLVTGGDRCPDDSSSGPAGQHMSSPTTPSQWPLHPVSPADMLRDLWGDSAATMGSATTPALLPILAAAFEAEEIAPTGSCTQGVNGPESTLPRSVATL